MLLHTTKLIFLLTILPPSLAIHCSDLRKLAEEDVPKKGDYPARRVANLLHPDNAVRHGYRIVKFTDCYMRVQNAGDPNRGGAGGHWTSAIVNDFSPMTTSEDVASTINNFQGNGGGNSQLWLGGGQNNGAWALAYTGWPGYWKTGKRCGLFEDPQDNLWGPNSAVTLILPGVVGSKLSAVTAAPNQLGLVGDLAGSLLGMALKDRSTPLTSADYAYVNYYELGWAAFERFLNRDASKHYVLAYTDVRDNDPAWRNSNCVVIDLRNLMKVDSVDESAKVPMVTQDSGKPQIWDIFRLPLWKGEEDTPPGSPMKVSKHRRWVPLPQL